MSLIYKNPITSSQLSGSESVSRTQTFGTNFSVLQTGGFMEVYELSNLDWSTYGATGIIQNTGNTIPIQFTVGGAANTLTLNSDNISSGRRRLGMLVYVYENDITYQYSIDNYNTLFGALTGLTGISAITPTEYTTVVNTRSQAGKDFVNAWTGSTIEGQDDVTRENARWKIYYGPQVFITGGTYDSGTTTLDLFNSTGGTISITGFSSDGGTTVTGGTYDRETGVLTINNSDDTSVNVSGFTDVYTTGGTLNDGNLLLFDSTGGTQTISGFTILEYVTYVEVGNLDTGSRLIDIQSSSEYSMIQYNYVLGDCDNYRAGVFTVVSDQNNLTYSEVATQSVGYTKNVVLSAITNSGNIEFRGSFPSDDWQINFVRTAIPIFADCPVPSLTPTPTVTPTITPSTTPIPSTTPTPTITPTTTPTTTITPTPTITPTTTPTITPTITPSITPSVTPTITPTSTVTPTMTPSITPSVTPTITPTTSITPTVTPSITPTSTVTPTITPTNTPTITPTMTPSITPTTTVTPSVTPTITPTSSVTPTLTPTPTVTPTSTPLYLEYQITATQIFPSISFPGPYTATWTDPYGNPASATYSASTELPQDICAIVGSVSVPVELLATVVGPCSVLPTPTPTTTATPTSTPNATTTPTPSVTPTTTPTITPTSSITPSVTPTITPTPTSTPL